MKKHLIKLFLVLSLTGNVIGIFLYFDTGDALGLKKRVNSVERMEQVRLELYLRLEKATEKNLQLQAKAKLDHQRIDDLVIEIRDLKKVLSRADIERNAGHGQSGVPGAGPSKSFKKGSPRGKISAAEAKANVKKLLLGIALKDEDGNESEGLYSDEPKNKFIRDILPFLSEKDAVLEGLLEVLKDDEQKDYHELAEVFLYGAISLAGSSRNFDGQIVDLLSNDNVNSELRARLVDGIDFEKYSKDPVFADKLLKSIESGGEVIQSSVLELLGKFEFDYVADVVERFAFDNNSDHELRQAAISSLKTTEDNTRGLLSLMTHENKHLRASAIDKLRKQPTIPALLSRIHSMAKSEQDPVLLRAMMYYLTSHGNQSSIPVLRELEGRKTLESYVRGDARNTLLKLEKKFGGSKSANK